MRSNDIEECFVIGGISIAELDGTTFYGGPFYQNQKLPKEGLYQYIPVLDFGRIQKFSHLKPGRENQETEIRGMLGS